MPSNAELANQMSALVDSWQRYIDQQIAIDNGVATYVTAEPPGQPGPGYYPLTMPNGITVWKPCIDRIRVDATGVDILTLPAANGHTVTAAHSGKVVLVTNNGGTTSNVTFPANLGAKFNAIYIWWGTHTTQRFIAGTGVTLLQDQELGRARARYSIVTAIAPTNNNIVLSGSMNP
jgi:hypothetical protein